ncbi:unnamed protein product [Paramecium primaurelia]|uniref:Uncharacterized protein n=1 Tax=Paramecium primaurelia TaxID=5886 RepID=A0A8S1MY72_PARPR|nr:unnamed protein product [Paramecium primaurelia]
MLDQRLLIIFIYWMFGFFNKVRVEDIGVDSPKLNYSKEQANNGYELMYNILNYSIKYQNTIDLIVYSIVNIYLNEKEIHQYKI